MTKLEWFLKNLCGLRTESFVLLVFFSDCKEANNNPALLVIFKSRDYFYAPTTVERKESISVAVMVVVIVFFLNTCWYKSCSMQAFGAFRSLLSLSLGDGCIIYCGIGVKGSNLFSHMKVKSSMMSADSDMPGIHLHYRQDYEGIINDVFL